jgi:N-acetylglucosamine-6-phosphate deacetylase
VACATENPAKAVGLWEKYGSIDNGKYADCVIVDEDFNIRQIVKHGKTVL